LGGGKEKKEGMRVGGEINIWERDEERERGEGEKDTRRRSASDKLQNSAHSSNIQVVSRGSRES
jgi:hypothetical protein